MQIHGPSESIATIPVERYTSGTVVMRLPCKVVLLIESAADCDRLMIAAAQARELLTGGSLQDLAAAQASPANPYTALSAAAVAQDVEPEVHPARQVACNVCVAGPGEPCLNTVTGEPGSFVHAGRWARWENRPRLAPTGHLPQHTGCEPGCTYGGCTDHAHDAGVTRWSARPDSLLTTAEVAAMWKVNAKTVRIWANSGRLPSTRTPGGQRRFWRSDVEALLNGDAS